MSIEGGFDSLAAIRLMSAWNGIKKRVRDRPFVIVEKDVTFIAANETIL